MEIQAVLSHDALGELVLGCDPYVVTQVQIGSPAVRAVVRGLALADGTADDSQYLGARAVTVTLRLKNAGACKPAADMQSLVDRVVPFMHPKLRPRLTYRMPGSESIRSMVVRGDSWPVSWDGPKFPTLPLSFVCPSGEIVADDGHGGGDVCTTIRPAGDVEEGRHYGLPDGSADDQYGPYFTNAAGEVERQYPPTQPIGGRVITNVGNAPAHWTLSIFGQAVNPSWTINGNDINFNRNGGLTLAGGQSVVIDTRTRSILLNGTPGDSAYDRVNYDEWAWSNLLLRPGRNIVLFGGENLSENATATFCYRPTFLG